MSGFVLTETDLGSKGRAKTACRKLPISITQETKWRVRVWWHKVLATARALCPVDTASLQMTIRMEDKGFIQGEGAPFEVVFSPKSKIISSEIVAGGLIINPKSGRIVDYAQAVHDGHFTRSGSWVPAEPFLRDAINIHINELMHVIDGGLDKSINTVWVG